MDGIIKTGFVTFYGVFRLIPKPIKIKNYSKKQAIDPGSNNQATTNKKEEFVVDWQTDKEERKKMRK